MTSNDVVSTEQTWKDEGERIVRRVVDLWSSPPSDPAEGLARFHSIYNERILFNGESIKAQLFHERLYGLHERVTDVSVRVLSAVYTPTQIAFGFQFICRRREGDRDISGTDGELVIDGLDLFTLDFSTGRVAEVWAAREGSAKVMEVLAD